MKRAFIIYGCLILIGCTWLSWSKFFSSIHSSHHRSGSSWYSHSSGGGSWGNGSGGGGHK